VNEILEENNYKKTPVNPKFQKERERTRWVLGDPLIFFFTT